MEKANIAQGFIMLPNGIGGVMGMDEEGHRVVGRIGSFRMCKEFQNELASKGVVFNQDKERCTLRFEETQKESQIVENKQQIHAEKTSNK